MPSKVSIALFAFVATASGWGCQTSEPTGRAGAAGSAGGAAGTGADGAAGASGAPPASGLPDGSVSDGYPVCGLDNFCDFYLTYCGTATPGYTTMAECLATFAAVGAANPYKQQCETYHLCDAIFYTGSDRTLHCSHAVGADNQCGF